MCDEFTLEAEQAAARHAGLSRRDFGRAGAATAAALGIALPAGAEAGLTEAAVTITTPDGAADAVFIHPLKGQHPAVVMWPDIAGIREANKLMARRLASSGYAVLLVNQYYRGAKAPVLPDFAAWRTPEGQERLKPLIATITPAGTERDAAAFVAWLDKQAAVDRKRGVGTCGYCMGGPFTVRTAAAVPGRVRAAASFHGASLVTDAPDSPHRLLAKTKARYLFAIARNDDARAPGDKDALKAAAAAAHRPAEIEVYPADHGWTVPDTPIYDKVAAERAWGRLLALFGTL